MLRQAVFDDTRTYRYLLLREWNDTLPRCLFIMLNPSSADEGEEDRTMNRCIPFARKFGFGSLEVVNLYALISTNPAGLRAARDPVGADNDKYIIEAAQRAGSIIAAWGARGSFNRRDHEVVKMLRSMGYPLHCLQLTKNGRHPRHPLYLKRDLELKPFAGAALWPPRE